MEREQEHRRESCLLCTHELIPLFNILGLAIVFDFFVGENSCKEVDWLEKYRERKFVTSNGLHKLSGRTLYTYIF